MKGVAPELSRASTSARWETSTCPERPLIEARWGSKPLASAGQLQPRRLIKQPFRTHPHELEVPPRHGSVQRRPPPPLRVASY
jgi:hypothetical protein